MKKSEIKSYLKGEIIEILSEESAIDIQGKTKAQSELNKELEKTKGLTSEAFLYPPKSDQPLGKEVKLREDEDDDEEMDDDAMNKAAIKGAKKGDPISKMADKLGETTREMKSIVNKYKEAVEPEKSKLIARLKELTKIKKEIESLL